MNAVRLGRTFRALRIRRGWRQQDLGDAAGVSQDTISLLERGHFDGMSVRAVARIAEAIGADVDITVRWRGGEIDRLLDEGHAALVGRMATLLDADGWQVLPEVTFAIYRDRGSIDLLAWHAPTATLLVVEIKTELTSIEETLRTHDMKVRVAGQVALERAGWRARAVARLLVLPDTSAARRRVARQDEVLGRAYPIRGREARAWLTRPSAGPGLLLFHASTTQGRGKCNAISTKRVRRPTPATPRA